MVATVPRTAPPAPFRFACPSVQFQIRVEGDCMAPAIAHGEYVRVDPARAPEDGVYVVFEHVERGLMVKQYRVEGDSAALVALNADIRYPVDARVRIVGVVTHIVRLLIDPGEYFRRRSAPPTRASRRAEKRRAAHSGRVRRHSGARERNVA